MNTSIEQLEYDLDLVTTNLVYGKLSLKSTDALVESLSTEVNSATDLDSAGIGDEDEEELYPEIRQGSLLWLVDSDVGLKFVDQLVEEINTGFYNLDISDGATEYQYTIYDNPTDHYDWHQDYYEDDNAEFVRKLSISVCLSSSEHYDGAEFFIKDGDELNVRSFKMKYGDFIVFPSDCEHRVNMLREGKRISLVIWYGYFKPED